MAFLYNHVKDKAKLPRRHDSDYYQTEKPLIRAVLETYRPPQAHTILDIGAGDDGRWGIIAEEFYPGATLTGIEKRPVAPPAGFDHWYQCVFPSIQVNGEFDLIVSNPPFEYAEAMVRAGFDLLAPAGTMIMLLKSSFTHSGGRYNDLWLTHAPVLEVRLSRRPSFYGGDTGGNECSIYIWRKAADGTNAGTPGRRAGGGRPGYESEAI